MEVPSRMAKPIDKTHSTNLRYQKPIDKPHRCAGATQAQLLEQERRLRMESHHDGDETNGSFYSLAQDYIEARESSRSVRTAGPKDSVT